MNKYSSVETVDTSNMSDQTKFRLNEIIKVEDYFKSETQERNIMCKKLSKYIAAFDYTDKTRIVLSAQVKEYLLFLLQVWLEYLPECRCKFYTVTSVFCAYSNDKKTIRNNKKWKEET